MGLSTTPQNFLSPHQSMLVNAEMIIFAIVFLPLMGYFSDKIEVKCLMCYGSMATIVVVLPLFLFLHQDISVTKVAMAIPLFAIFYASYVAPMGAFLVNLFPPQERYTGLGLGTALGSAISGAVTSLVVLLLMRLTDNGTALALYVMFCGGIGWLSVSKAHLVVGTSQRDDLGPGNYETKQLLVKEA
jgi:MFS family permease